MEKPTSGSLEEDLAITPGHLEPHVLQETAEVEAEVGRGDSDASLPKRKATTQNNKLSKKCIFFE